MDLQALAIPVLSFAAVMAAVIAVSTIGGKASRLSQRLRHFTTSPKPAQAESAPAPVESEFRLLREEKYSNWALLDQMISGRSWAEREAAELTRANVPLRVGEYLMLRYVAGLGLLTLVFFALHNLLFAAAAGLIGYFLPRVWVKRCQSSRRRLLDEQLVEAITLLASTLKSGYSFLQGMEAVAREMPPPMSEEFDRLIKEIGVGARADEALLRLVERTRSNDLELVVTAIMIQRTVGGELAGILETIVRTIRERQKIKRDISTLTAQQRWSGYVIGALPIFLMLIIGWINPAYVGELLYTLHGKIMLAVAGAMEMAGFFMIRRIIAIEV